MKLPILVTLASLALGSFTAAASATPALTTVTPRPHDTAASDWTDAIKDALVVYENKDTFVQKVRFAMLAQYQMASVQPNGGNGGQLKTSASPFNQEFRRVWLGLNVDFASGTHFHTWMRPGGLPMKETYGAGVNGRTKRNFSYTNLFDLWVQQDIKSVKGLSVKVGKIKPLFTTEYSTASSAIKTVERSIVGNQYGLDSNWGIDVTYAPNKQDKFYWQLFANDRAPTNKDMKNGDIYRDGRGFKGEFGWEDQCYTIIGASHKFNQTASGYHQISAQYAHDFNTAYHGKKKGNNCFGIGVKDALSLGYDWKQDKLSVMANLVFNFETQTGYNGHGGNNVGLVLMPIYAINPHVDLVFRYTGMTGDNACKLGADRFITTQCTSQAAPSWADSLHAVYFGVDLYASAKNPNAAKLMFGAEYMTARQNGSDCYSGWEFTTAIRTSF